MWAMVSLPELSACRDSERGKWERHDCCAAASIQRSGWRSAHTNTHTFTLTEFPMMDFIDFRTQENIIVYKID